jgi:tRNA threonylcarbamoyladenosine biosynthesis protein TsaB
MKEGELVATVAHESAEPYSSWLFFEVAGLVKSALGDMCQIEAYGVANGPGSFTGLRVGLTAVKAWAEIYGRRVIPVSRLEAVAVQAKTDSRIVAAFLDASRGQIFGGLYERQGRTVRPLSQEMVGSGEEFLAWVLSEAKGERVGWVSPDAPLLCSSIEQDGKVSIEVEPASLPLSPVIARIAADRLNQGIFTDALHLDANYVRRSDAEILWKEPKAPLG